MAYALLNHVGDPNPAKADLAPDRPCRRNRNLIARIRSDWKEGKRAEGATQALLAVLREGTDEAACKTLGAIEAGTGADAILDEALHLLIRKGTGAHDYKYTVTVLEDVPHVSPAWRGRYLAACTSWLGLRPSATHGAPRILRAWLGVLSGG